MSNALIDQVMARLVVSGMPVDEIVEVIKKMTWAEGVTADEKEIEREILLYIELNLQDKIKGGGARKSIQDEVSNWLYSNESNNPCYSNVAYSLHDCYLDLELKTPSEKAMCRMAFKRLVEKGKLEPLKIRSGLYRIINGKDEVIDFMGADINPYNLKLPLGIHEFVTIHPGNVIIIAGESNSGKTAFCLNVAKLNMNNLITKYMSSEMQDGAELKIRLQKFGEPLEIWSKVKFLFRTDNFPEKIDPDDLNVIDYLDEGTDSEAYKMPMRIRLIADKLKKGVAIIALQKDPNKGLGFGGSGTLNRSRLYITLSKGGVLKIEKGKIWRNEGINPNGMFCDFKLVAGCKFMRVGDWKQ